MIKKDPSSSLTVLPPETGELAAVSADFGKAVKYYAAAEVCARMSIALMIACGMELIRLHKAYGISPGRKPKNLNSRTRSGISWPDLIQQFFGKSEDWARLVMMTSDEARKRFPEVLVPALLTLPPGDWPEDKLAALNKLTTKSGKPETWRQLMFDWGILKKPSGGKGGGSGRPEGSGDADTPADAAQAMLWPIENALGSTRRAPNFEAMVLHLPEHRASENELTASLDGLHEELTAWLDLVDAAIKEQKKHRRARS